MSTHGKSLSLQARKPCPLFCPKTRGKTGVNMCLLMGFDSNLLANQREQIGFPMISARLFGGNLVVSHIQIIPWDQIWIGYRGT